MAQDARKKPAAKAAAKPRRRRKADMAKPEGPWWALTLAMIAVVLILRLAVNATEPFGVHPVEAEAWALGQELDWGYLNHSPMLAWAAGAATWLGGDGLFVLRALSPLAHAAVAWLIFLTGRQLWGGATGFWAAAGYTAAPGVGFSAMMLTADPVMLILWAGALYAWMRAAEAERKLWWGVLGALVGAGLLAGQAMLAFAAGALLCGLLSARERDWKGTGVAVAVSIAVVVPTLAWNGAHGVGLFPDLPSVLDADEDRVSPWRLTVFLAMQMAVIGPVFLIAILLTLGDREAWIEDWGMRVVAWMTVPLLVATLVLALVRGAEPQWAAPAYIGGSLLAARWLVVQNGAPALKAQLGLGALAAIGLWVLTGLYAGQTQDLTKRLDPFREMRLSAPLCELVLGTMAEEGAEVLLSDKPDRLSECMYYGGLSWDEVAIWNPRGQRRSHHDLASSLQPGDARAMLLVTQGDPGPIAGQFAEAREIDQGGIETHKDRTFPFRIWSVEGFGGY